MELNDETPNLRISGIEVAFGGNRILTGVDLNFTPGFNGLIGPNGAGKTTMFNVISRYVTPSAGRVELGGQNLCELGQVGVAKAGISRTFQSPRLVSDATVMENTLLGRHYLYRSGHVAELLRLKSYREEERQARAICMETLAAFGLAELAHKPGGSLSLGSQKLVEVARALVSEPKVVLLDEPAAGLGSGDVAVMLEGLNRYARRHPIVFVIIEHDLGLVSDLCHTVSVLDYGKIIASGEPGKVTADPAVIEAYLGSGFTPEANAKEEAQ